MEIAEQRVSIAGVAGNSFEKITKQPTLHTA